MQLKILLQPTKTELVMMKSTDDDDNDAKPVKEHTLREDPAQEKHGSNGLCPF